MKFRAGAKGTTNGGVKGRSNFCTYCRQNSLWSTEAIGCDPVKQPREFDHFCPVRSVTTNYPPTLLLHWQVSSPALLRRYRQSPCCSAHFPMPVAESHSARSGRTSHGNDNPGCTWPQCTAGAVVFARFQWSDWVLRPCPYAYLPTPTRPKQGPFPCPTLSTGFSGTMNLSDLCGISKNIPRKMTASAFTGTR